MIMAEINSPYFYSKFKDADKRLNLIITLKPMKLFNSFKVRCKVILTV